MNDPTVNAPVPALEKPFVVFKVVGMVLGLRVDDVSRIIPRVALRKVPELPPVIEGFVELSDELIPVLNLSHLFGLSTVSAHDVLNERAIHEQMIVAKYGGRKIAWRCDDGTKIVHGAQGELIELPQDHVLNNCAKWTLIRPNEKTGIVILEPGLLLLHEEEVRMSELAERLSQRKLLAVQSSAQG